MQSLPPVGTSPAGFTSYHEHLTAQLLAGSVGQSDVAQHWQRSDDLLDVSDVATPRALVAEGDCWQPHDVPIQISGWRG